MNKFLFLGAVVLAASLTASAGSICPSTAYTNTDCGAIVTINADGSTSASPVAGANPYDGSDDALIGIVNNSGTAFNGSFVLGGSGNGGGLFLFDGDGICAYVTAPYCATAFSSYEGPGVTFSNISQDFTTGSVNVANLSAGGTTYFSLEGSPASIASAFPDGSSGGSGGTGGSGPAAAAPEPASLSLLGLGAAGVFAVFRRRRQA